MEKTRVRQASDPDRAEASRRSKPQAVSTTEGLEALPAVDLASPESFIGNRGIIRMQSVLGNQAVSRLVDSASSEGVIQRHPAGSDLLPDSATTVSEESSDLPPGESIFKKIGRAFKKLGRKGKKDKGGGEPVQDVVEEDHEETTEPTSSTTGKTTEPPTPTPRPSSPYFMELSRAQELLQAQYGGESRTIVPGNMVVLDDGPAILAKYDEVCMAANLTNPSTGEKWKSGDALARNPFGLNGFAWQNAVYINRMTSSPTTTIHEMLHLNTATDFRGKVGETINEGTTQYLTVKTLKAAGVALPSSIPYQAEMDLAEGVAKLVSDATMISAYFGGADSLITAFESKQGKGTWAAFKAKADAKEYVAATELLKPPTTPTPTPTTTEG